MFRSHDVILLYHRVGVIESDPWSLCITPEHFVEHLELLRACMPITLGQVKPAGAYGSRRPRVAITFDDGYADNLYTAKPLLERYGIPATIFVVTGYVGPGREFWWDELEKVVFGPKTLSGTVRFTGPGEARSFNADELPRSALHLSLYRHLQPMPHEQRRVILNQLLDWSHQSSATRESHRVVTAEEVCELGKGGLVEIGAHTVTHPQLASQPLARQQAELRNSKARLEDLCGRPIASFSYPFGGSRHYSQETVRAVREAGFLQACTTEARRVTHRDSLYELPRFNAGVMTGDDLEKLLFA